MPGPSNRRAASSAAPARRLGCRARPGGSWFCRPDPAPRRPARRAAPARAGDPRPEPPPPPITTSSGSNVLIAFAISMPMRSPHSSTIRVATGSFVARGIHRLGPRIGLPSARRRPTLNPGLPHRLARRPVERQPGCDRLERAGNRKPPRQCDRMVHFQPDDGVAKIHRRRRRAPVIRPPSTIPAATPVPIVASEIVRDQRRSSSWASASAATVASCRRTGTPSRSPSTWRSGTSTSGMFTEQTTRPVSNSTTEGTPTPIASFSLPHGFDHPRPLIDQGIAAGVVGRLDGASRD